MDVREVPCSSGGDVEVAHVYLITNNRLILLPAICLRIAGPRMIHPSDADWFTLELSPWMRNPDRPKVLVPENGVKRITTGPFVSCVNASPMVHSPRGIGPTFASFSASGLFTLFP